MNWLFSSASIPPLLIFALLTALVAVIVGIVKRGQQLQNALQEKDDLANRAKEQAQWLFGFNRAVERISLGMDQDRLLQDVVTESMNVLNADRCALYLVNAETRAITCPMSHGLSEEYVESILAQTESVPGTSVLRTGKPLLVHDALHDPAYRPFHTLLEKEGIRGIALYPLHYRGKVVGVLTLYFDEPHTFAEDEVEASTIFTHIVAAGIEHVRTLSRERRRLSELEALREVSMQISSSLDLSTVLETVARRARETIGATDTHLFTYDAGRDVFTFGLSSWSPDASHPRQTITPRRDGLTALVARTGAEMIINHVPDHLLYQDMATRAWDMQSIAGFPIKLRGRVVGVLNAAFETAHTFTISEIRLLSMLADNAAIAVENANLYQEMADLNRNLEQRVVARTQETHTLMQLGQKLASVLSQEELTTVLMEAIHQLLTPDAVLCLLCPTAYRSVVTICGPLYDETRLRMLDQMRENFVDQGGKLAANAALEVSDLSANHLDSPPAPLHWPIPSQLHAPLKLHNQTIGLLSVCGRGAETFTEQDERYLTSVALQASNALARLDALEERQRSRLQAILDSMPDGLLLLDEEGEIVVASPTAQEMISLLADLGEDGRVERIAGYPLEKIQQAVQDEGAFTAETTVGMQPLVFDLQARPVFERGEQLPGILVRIADVTHDRRTQEQLFQTSKLASVGELAAGVAHEINNPLTVVIGFSELLMNRIVDEEQQHMLERIVAAGQRTRNIVQDLLQFSRGLQTRKLVRDDINNVVAQTVNLLRRQIELEGIDVIEEYTDNLPWITTDSGGVGQIVLNLIQNARDAIHDSQVGARISVRTERAGPDHLQIVVEDDGPGISPDVLSRIFNPFFTTKPPGQGTGLGLSISHRIASELGGTLRVCSIAKQNTTFTLRLPIAAPLPENPPDPTEPPSASPAGRDTLTNRRILVVDDEEPARDVFQQILTLAGAQVTLLDDGQAALEHLLTESKPYDAILLDIKMPGLEGTELFKQLVNSRPEIARRVMFVTGDVISNDTSQFLRNSERIAVAKPFSREELLGAVQEVLARLDRG